MSVSVSLDDALVSRLDAVASSHASTREAVMGQALYAYLDEEDLRQSVARGREDVATGAIRSDTDVEAFFHARREALLAQNGQ